jgi:hypothetical protein
MSRDSHDRFDIAGGSVPGRSHVLAGRGNQDAWAYRAAGDRLVAVVCDGCGSAPHSEVGARLGARIVSTRLFELLSEGTSLDEASLWDALRDDLLGALAPLARLAGESVEATVSDLFLFTIVGLAIRGDEGRVFAAGDGLVVIDGAVTRLGPFPGDAPPYVGYGLMGAKRHGFSVVKAFDARAIHHALVGTDGATALADAEGEELSRTWLDDRHFTNRDGLRRTLALWNREEARPLWAERRIERRRGLFEDDATVVVVRRKAA